jgi:hypothetical protein
MIFKEENFLEPKLYKDLQDKTEYLYKISKVETATMAVKSEALDSSRGIYSTTESVIM